MKLNTTGDERRFVRRQNAIRYGTREYPSAKRCCLCGTLNYERRRDGVCKACVQRGRA